MDLTPMKTSILLIQPRGNTYFIIAIAQHVGALGLVNAGTSVTRSKGFISRGAGEKHPSKHKL